MILLRARFHLLLVIVAMVLAACASVPPGADTAGAGAPPATAAASGGSGSAPQSGEGRPPTSLPGVQRSRAKLALPRELEDAILAIDPAHVTDAEIRGPLARAPAPRMILLHGGIYPVHLVMVSFGRFLTEMGYPERAIRDPGNGDWSYSPYENADVLAGMVAWQYEHDGMRPMLIGHSQGGMQAVKILHELAGHFTPDLKVFDPVRHEFENRTTIVDPITGRTRSAVGVSVCYASVVGAGGAAFLLPNQWDMVGKLRSIPDTVDDFTGYFIALDLIAWSFPGANEEERFRAEGSAKVRNIELPGSYNHVMLPAVAQLGQDPATRAAINAYTPGSTDGVAADTVTGAAWAADVWYGIKRHWVSELQRLIRAQRAARAIGTTAQETVIAH